MKHAHHVGTRFDIPKADFIEAVEKVLAVLESFDTERQRLNATMAAQRAGITRAAARRHLLTLASLGYLETEGGFFWLTPKVLRFSGSYLASARLPRIVQPTLERIAAQAAEATSVVVLDGDEVVIIGRSGPTRLRAYGLHLGARLPAHATSTGRVLLANLPQDVFETWLRGKELRKLTPNTVVDTASFRRLIEQVRQADYCVADAEHEQGVAALAVPLRDLQGRTLAAMNVVLSSGAAWTADRFSELLFHIQDGARELRGLI